MRFSFSFSFGVGDNRSFFHTPTPNEKPNESLVNNCATTDRSCDQGENNSDRHLMKLRMVKSYDKKILYLNMLFIFILTTMILIVIVSK